jgi:hypothetical protein
MTADTLLMRLGRLGVSVQADGADLRLRPASAIPAALLVELRQHKAQLLTLLTMPAVPADRGTLPAGPCPFCGLGLWWRVSACEPGGPGQWACERCEPPPPDLWRDACAVPVAGEDGCREDR